MTSIRSVACRARARRQAVNAGGFDDDAGAGAAGGEGLDQSPVAGGGVRIVLHPGGLPGAGEGHDQGTEVSTWSHDATIGAGGEPAVARLGDGKMTALLRGGPFKPFHQVVSEDDGKTWSAPVLIEEGSICPDLVPMCNGLLAASYGRPANSLMFSADGGRTWSSHHVITDKTGFNYSGMVEVRPGRLLYVHDAGGLQALHIDVERTTAASAKKGHAKDGPAIWTGQNHPLSGM